MNIDGISYDSLRSLGAAGYAIRVTDATQDGKLIGTSSLANKVSSQKGTYLELQRHLAERGVQLVP